MKRLAFAIALCLTGAAQAAPCGNVLHNITRTMECEAYTMDWQTRVNLRDKRADAMSEWINSHANDGGMLDLMLKEATLRRSHALTRDIDIYKDADMWKMRGCDQLPLCVAQDKPTSVVKAKPAPRNRRTGGNYCGPRDTRNGYCD